MMQQRIPTPTASPTSQSTGRYKLRLKKIRKASGYSIVDIINILGIPRQTYYQYENEIHEIPYSLLHVFADFFNVTIDYLLGHTKTNFR